MDITQLNMKQEEQDGVLASVVLHIALILIFFIPWLVKTITPPQSITGISVVFDTPFEESEYTPIVDAPAPKASQAEVKTATPAKQEETPPREEVKEDVVVEAKAKLTKVVNEPKETVKSPTPVDVVSETTTDQAAEIAAAKQKAKQAAEDEAKLKAKQEAEAAAAKLKAKQEAEAAEAAKLKASKDKFGSLFGSSGGATSAEESTDIGGSDSGELDAISTGSGGDGAGLNSRGITYKPTFADNSDREGRVVVQICVNSSGKVISTEFVQSGSTTTDRVLIDKALSGAKQYKFEVNQSITKQCGEITIDFKVK